MVGVAVNVTLLPAQMVVFDALITIAGVTGGFTVIVILPVAVGVVTHVKLLVMVQLTTLPVTSVPLE